MPDARPPVDPAAVVANLARVRQRIADAGGDPGVVTVLAVTKGFGADAPRAALAAGLWELGENYAQELVAKAEALAASPGSGPAPAWQFIGRLQRNKVKVLAPWVRCWGSVDRIELGREIARRQPGAAVLVQVNVSGELQKGGAAPDAVPTLVAELRDLGLDVRGLLAVGATGPAEAARPGFRTLRALADDLDLHERSMGMTGDLEVAVQEGATQVRVGTALFGARAPRSGVRDYGSRVQED